MTMADFLYQAGFWQWIGIITITALLAVGASEFRLWGNITNNKTKNIYTEKQK